MFFCFVFFNFTEENIYKCVYICARGTTRRTLVWSEFLLNITVTDTIKDLNCVLGLTKCLCQCVFQRLSGWNLTLKTGISIKIIRKKSDGLSDILSVLLFKPSVLYRLLAVNANKIGAF